VARGAVCAQTIDAPLTPKVSNKTDIFGNTESSLRMTLCISISTCAKKSPNLALYLDGGRRGNLRAARVRSRKR
jgi:hypothetical protein